MKILSFDIESCNGNPKQASLCSFGYCITDENFNIIEQKDILVNPVPKKFTLTNFRGNKGIKLAYEESVFRASPIFLEVYDTINYLIKSADLIVGFSVNNDINYLNSACEHYNLPNFEFEFIDVQQIASLYYGEQKSLEKYMNELNKDFVFHESDEDARAAILVLQNLCNLTNKSIKELLEYYLIQKGKNSQNGFVNSYSLSQMLGKKGLKPTSKIVKYLFSLHLTRLKRQKEGSLKGKYFHFSKKLAYTDINLSRSLLTAIYVQGGLFVNNIEDCTYFVYAQTEKLTVTEEEFVKDNPNKVLPLEELYKMLNNFKVEHFNDEEYIKKYFNNIVK